jgi:hypothetical protein
MKKDSAVEWLIEQLTPSISLQQKHIDELKEKAKEMEKEQIIKAYWSSYKEGQYSGDKTADEYYNETFKQQEQ